MANAKIRLILWEKLYPGSQNKTWSWLWLRSWAPYCKIQAYIEVGKTIRPLRYDLNQIPYAHTVGGEEQIQWIRSGGSLPEGLWTEVCNIVQEVVTKTISKGKKYKKAKWLSETNTWGKKRSQRQGRTGEIYSTKCRVWENGKER